METLLDFGWTDELDRVWQALPADGTRPGRVVADFGTSYKVACPEVIAAELAGKLAHHSSRLDVPKVGDWVQVRPYDSGTAVIEALLPRRNEIARKAPGNQTRKQVIAANVDIAFVTLALDSDFSIDRLRRFLYQLSVHSIKPIIVLNKADKTDRLEPYFEQLAPFNLTVLTAVATEGKGVEELLAHIAPGQTAILLGSSGVGKSTLTNQLLGRVAQKTQTIRASDETGKHTTVHRELFVLPNGGLLVDTPGIRELQLWGSTEALDDNFDDIARLMTECKYTSCTHHREEGCAVQRALQSGELVRAHYDAFLKLKGELSSLRERTVARAKLDNRKSKAAKKKQSRQERDESRAELF